LLKRYNIYIKNKSIIRWIRKTRKKTIITTTKRKIRHIKNQMTKRKRKKKKKFVCLFLIGCYPVLIINILNYIIKKMRVLVFIILIAVLVR